MTEPREYLAKGVSDACRITFDPKVMGGRACIRGMRITVAHIVNMVANGMATEEIIREYPDLEAEDVRQSLQYAAFLTREEVYPTAGSREQENFIERASS